MAETGASLQNTNNELVKSIEELREKRAECDRCITKEEEEKARIVHELQILTERLRRIDEGLNKKYTARAEYDKAITETENAFGKILESSKTLLHVLRKESQTLKAKVGE
jgi:Sjoegren syndrome nuclear autoantigen 1